MARSVATAHPTEIPGLFDVHLPDGSWRFDLTSGQVWWLAYVGDFEIRPATGEEVLSEV